MRDGELTLVSGSEGDEKKGGKTATYALLHGQLFSVVCGLRVLGLTLSWNNNWKEKKQKMYFICGEAVVDPAAPWGGVGSSFICGEAVVDPAAPWGGVGSREHLVFSRRSQTHSGGHLTTHRTYHFAEAVSRLATC
jgi:hypothetical protein